MSILIILALVIVISEVANSSYWMETYYFDEKCTILDHTSAMILNTCFSYEGLTSVAGSYQWVLYHTFTNYAEIRRLEYVGNTICEGLSATTTKGYASYTACTPVVGSTNKWYMATFPSDPVPKASGSAILAYRYADELCSAAVTQAVWYPSSCVVYTDETTLTSKSKKTTCSLGSVDFNIYSNDVTCTTSTSTETIKYPTCAPNPYATNDNDPSAQYVVTFCTVAPSPAAAPCFAGTETVQLESGEIKSMHQVKVGDKILASVAAVSAADNRTGGKLLYSEVISTPHKHNNHIASDFQYLVTSGGRSIKLTTDHLLLAGECNCSSSGDDTYAVGDANKERSSSQAAADVCEPLQSMSLVTAASVKIGQCLLTVAGAESVVQSHIIHSSNSGLYTLVTLDGDFIVVNGIIASPFAINHAIVDGFYNIHRVLYKYSLLPRQVLQSEMFRLIVEQLGLIMIHIS